MHIVLVYLYSDIFFFFFIVTSPRIRHPAWRGPPYRAASMYNEVTYTEADMPDPSKKENTIYGPACPHRHHRPRTATSARTATSRAGHSSIPASWRAVTHWFSPPTRSAVSVSPIRRLVWGPLSIGHRCATPSLGVYAPVGASLVVWALVGTSLGHSVQGLVVFGTDVPPPRQVYRPLLSRRSVRGLVVFGTDVPPPLSELLSRPPGALSPTDRLITAEVQLRRNSLSG